MLLSCAGLTLAALSSPSSHPVAEAAQATCGTSTAILANGISAYSTAVYGAGAWVETNLPALCAHVAGSTYVGSPSISTAWVMVTPSQDEHWAQAGYIRVGSTHPIWSANSGTHYVTQYTSACRPNCGPNASGVNTTFTGQPDSVEQYAAYLRASDDRIHMTVNGNDLDVMHYDVTGVWDNDWRVQLGGETHHLGTDMPGLSNDTTRFNLIKKYNSTGGTSFVSTLNPYPSDSYLSTYTRYHRTIGNSPDGGKDMEIWTSPTW